MKKIFKITLIISMILVGINVNAQEDEREVSFGLTAGFNMSHFIGDAEGSDIRYGFVGGITLDWKLTKERITEERLSNFYLMTGLIFTQRGSKTHEYIVEKNPKITLSYIQIPAYFGFKIGGWADSKTKFVVYLGPYVAYGIGGKTKFETEPSESSFGLGKYKRLDLGAGVGIGIESSGIGFKVGFDLSLLNIRDHDTFKQKNFVGYSALVYKF